MELQILLYLGMILFGLAMGLSYLYLKGKRQIQSYAEQIKNQQIILEHNPLPWCTVHLQSNHFFCSSSFRHFLGLQNQNTLAIDDFFRIFSATPLTTLHKAVQNLTSVGGIFSLHEKLKNKEILITGHKLSPDDKNDYIYITLEDVTKKYEQQKKLEQFNRHAKKENKILNDILNEVPFAIWHRDNHGRIDYCNDIYAKTLDFSREKVIAENLDLLPKNELDLYLIAQEALKEQKRVTTRTRAIIGGDRRLLEIAAVPLADATFGYALDITEIQNIQTQLTSTIKSYREIFNTVSVPVAVFDSHKLLSYYNRAYAHFFGFQESFLESSPTFSDILDDLRQRKKIPDHPNFQQYKATRHELFQSLIAPVEEFSDLPDGKTIRLRIAPYPFGGLIFVFENITNQLDLERGVNTLLAVQKETLNHLYEGLIVIGSDGKIRLINPAIQTIFNNKEDLLDSHMNSWIKTTKDSFNTHDQFQEWQQCITHLFVDRHPSFDQLHLKNDLVLKWFYIPLPDGSHMLGFLNISEDWKHEKNLTDKNKSLIALDTLKQTYVKEVTHQLQPPLENILGISRNLKDQVFGEMNELQLSYCSLIYNNTSTLKFLIDDILCLINADQIHVKPESILIRPMLDSLVSLLRPMLDDQGIDLFVDHTSEDVNIHADKRRLKQASLALIKDLLKNIPEGSEIRLKPDFTKDLFSLDIISPKIKKQANNLGTLIAKKIIDSHKGTLTQWNDKDLHITRFEIPKDLTKA